MSCIKAVGSSKCLVPARSFTTLQTRRVSQTARMCAPMVAQGTRSKIQELYELAKEHLNDGPPSKEAAAAISKSLGSIPLSELGFPSQGKEQVKQEAGGIRGALGRLMRRQQSNAQASSSGRAPPMTYMHIHEEPAFSLGIFCLPRGNQIPLHNHPGMSVFSRVLVGSMHVRSFDWAEPSQNIHTQGGHARLCIDRTVHEGDPPAVLYPTSGGNIHEFTPVTDCAVLDLLSPPYSPREGRDCTYFREEGKLQDAHVQLKPYKPADEFLIGNEPYRGQRIVHRRE
ncbi:hypothetical protein CVIRNUC_007761 [Coccomyxa viridis]|uniref:cysteine dioxygenase n=1 Tax=Coccomyxa viridis TaxID=1274662 RepID=A0AAV1IED4_9CHLO|nr:hypothetical protein CVIRNUC_007761 [Coccomyxa viridis]